MRPNFGSLETQGGVVGAREEGERKRKRFLGIFKQKESCLPLVEPRITSAFPLVSFIPLYLAWLSAVW